MQKLSAVKDASVRTMSDDSLVSIVSSTREVQTNTKSLLESLQTTLEMEQMLSIFAQHVMPLRVCKSLKFITDDSAFTLMNQESRVESDSVLHQHTALLYADDHYLGQLVYTLRQPLSAATRRSLDSLHRQLTFPLRNAIVYGRTRQQAIRDYLTGLGNRSYLEEVLQHALYQQQRASFPCGLMLIDLDGFKDVNDQYGHQQGDQVLTAFSELLSSQLRDCDQLFRFGGDEFVVILEETSLVGVQYAFSRLQAALAKTEAL